MKSQQQNAKIITNLAGEKVTANPYQEIDLEFLTMDVICDHDLYLKNGEKYVLYRRKNLPFTQKDKARLSQSRTQFVYVFCENEKELRRFFEANLPNIIENKNIPVKQKADVLYKCATGIAQEIFENPQNKETIAKSKDVVNHTMRLMSQSSDAFLRIISLSSHDYYTYTHCVNVMTFTVGLLSLLGVKDEIVLKEAGMGALLHDIGKSKIPLHILNKPSKLNEDEWSFMKRHPTYGYEMLTDMPIPDRGREIVIQHHEKLSGTGYPKGLKGEAVPIVSQVVAICDAYDAMTTNRCYQRAMKPFDAFKIITQEMRGHFNPSVVEKFIRLLNLKK